MDESAEQTKLVSANQSDLFAEGSTVIKRGKDNEISQSVDFSNTSLTKKNSRTRNGVNQEGSSNSFGGPGGSFLMSSSSKHRNNDFIEYVVGADTLLPKRVRSKKSDLPYSQGGS